MADRYVWPVILTQMYKQVSIKVCSMDYEYMSFITDTDITYNQNYRYLKTLPKNPTAKKLSVITKSLTLIIRSYLAGTADWQEVEEALRRI